MTTELDCAVIHDGAINPGGAVDVSLNAARALGADLFVGFSGVPEEWWESRAPAEVEVLTQRNDKSFFQDIRVARLMVNLHIPDYDVVLTSGPTAKFFQPYDDQYHIHYMHHPPQRVMWFEGGMKEYILKFVDRAETNAIPSIIANSQFTASRIRCHYGRHPEAVINPPVDVDKYQNKDSSMNFVLLGRLEDRKRTMLALDAWDIINEESATVPELHLVGDGPLRDIAERRARDNEAVAVHGYVSDEKLDELLSTAGYGLFLAKREDFGITPIEYLAAGCPVVAIDEPNTNNQIVDGENGVLVDSSPSSVANGVSRIMNMEWDRDSLSESVQEYNYERYREEILDFIEQCRV